MDQAVVYGRVVDNSLQGYTGVCHATKSNVTVLNGVRQTGLSAGFCEHRRQGARRAPTRTVWVSLGDHGRMLSFGSRVGRRLDTSVWRCSHLTVALSSRANTGGLDFFVG